MINPAVLDLLKTCLPDPAAACKYDVMAGGLIWDDEIPSASDRGANLRVSVHLRSVIAYRASLSLGEPRPELERDWHELKDAIPTWPGFASARIFGEAQRLLRIHKYKESKLIERELGDL